jgi:hypothetical protein
MAEPHFIKTSAGYINLAAVIHIGNPEDGMIWFYFVGRGVDMEGRGMGPYRVSLPEAEGWKVIDAMLRGRPDWFGIFEA